MHSCLFCQALSEMDFLINMRYLVFNQYYLSHLCLQKAGSVTMLKKKLLKVNLRT